eukprot:Rmarinus@m.3040
MDAADLSQRFEEICQMRVQVRRMIRDSSKREVKSSTDLYSRTLREGPEVALDDIPRRVVRAFEKEYNMEVNCLTPEQKQSIAPGMKRKFRKAAMVHILSRRTFVHRMGEKMEQIEARHEKVCTPKKRERNLGTHWEYIDKRTGKKSHSNIKFGPDTPARPTTAASFNAGRSSSPLRTMPEIEFGRDRPHTANSSFARTKSRYMESTISSQSKGETVSPHLRSFTHYLVHIGELDESYLPPEPVPEKAEADDLVPARVPLGTPRVKGGMRAILGKGFDDEDNDDDDDDDGDDDDDYDDDDDDSQGTGTKSRQDKTAAKKLPRVKEKNSSNHRHGDHSRKASMVSQVSRSTKSSRKMSSVSSEVQSTVSARTMDMTARTEKTTATNITEGTEKSETTNDPPDDSGMLGEVDMLISQGPQIVKKKRKRVKNMSRHFNWRANHVGKIRLQRKLNEMRLVVLQTSSSLHNHTDAKMLLLKPVSADRIEEILRKKKPFLDWVYALREATDRELRLSPDDFVNAYKVFDRVHGVGPQLLRELMSRIRYFRHFPKAFREEVLRAFRLRVMPAGELLYREGEEDTGRFLVLLTGEMHIEKDFGSDSEVDSLMEYDYNEELTGPIKLSATKSVYTVGLDGFFKDNIKRQESAKIGSEALVVELTMEDYIMAVKKYKGMSFWPMIEFFTIVTRGGDEEVNTVGDVAHTWARILPFFESIHLPENFLVGDPIGEKVLPEYVWFIVEGECEVVVRKTAIALMAGLPVVWEGPRVYANLRRCQFFHEEAQKSSEWAIRTKTKGGVDFMVIRADMFKDLVPFWAVDKMRFQSEFRRQYRMTLRKLFKPKTKAKKGMSLRFAEKQAVKELY